MGRLSVRLRVAFEHQNSLILGVQYVLCRKFNSLFFAEHHHRVAVALAVLGQLAPLTGPLMNEIVRGDQRYIETTD